VKIIAVIPARYGSSRFEGKVLAKETGKFLVQHTYERVCAAKFIERVLIATDDERVMTACRSFGAECVMTSSEHRSGTDRIAEAIADVDVEIVTNVQADEPEIDPRNIDYLSRLLLDNPQCPMATLVSDFENKEQIADANIVKVVTDGDGYARYFSRSVIPYDRQAEGPHFAMHRKMGTRGIGQVKEYLRHLGIYAYRKDFLLEITSLPQTKLERMEKLEQLRPIEYGYSILTSKVEHNYDGIDTPEQYAKFVARQKVKK